MLQPACVQDSPRSGAAGGPRRALSALSSNTQKRDESRDEGGDDPRFVVADVLALEGCAGASLALEARPPVYDGVMAEERERKEEGRGGEPGGAMESHQTHKRLHAHGGDRQDTADISVRAHGSGAGETLVAHGLLVTHGKREEICDNKVDR